MMIQEIYDATCSALLERGGLQLGLITLAQFTSFYSDSLQDFLGRTGLAKTICVIPQQFGIAEYLLPDFMGEPDMVISQGKTLAESSESDIADFDQNWQAKIKTPRLWRQDKMTMKDFSIFPAPLVDGNQPLIGTGGGGFYGTIASVVAGSDINITTSAPLYGTIAAESGAATLIPSGPMFGTIADLETSASNLAIIGTVAEFNESPDLDYPVEWLPDSFALYVGYGVLAKVWSLDGETKDNGRAQYCLSRYDEGIQIGRIVMDEAMLQGESNG